MTNLNIQIPKELNDSLEQRHYEVEGIKHLLGFALSTTEYTIPSEKIDELNAKLGKSLNEYEQLKGLINELIPEEIRNKNNATWTLNFQTSTITVTFEE